MINYFLKTERLGFSEWCKDFRSYAVELWRNKQVSRHVTAEGIFSIEEIDKRLDFEILNQQLYNIQYYPLFLLDKDIFIGCCGLKPYDIELSIYEHGFYLLPQYWGKGYVYEAATRIIEHVQNTIDVKNIYAGHHPNNLASKKALERLGFHYFKDEYYAPTNLYHPLYRLSDDHKIDA